MEILIRVIGKKPDFSVMDSYWTQTKASTSDSFKMAKSMAEEYSNTKMAASTLGTG